MKIRQMPKGTISLLTGSLIIIGLGAFHSYWQWTRSPRYSARQIRVAVGEHDFAKFQKFVDIESVGTRAIDDLLALRLLESSPTEAEDNVVAAGLVQLVKPRLLDEFKKQISRYIESGKFSGQSEVINTFNQLERRGQSFSGFAGTQTEGKVCVLGLRFTNNVDKGYMLELKMRQMGGYWQLVELSNLGSILQAARAEAKAQADAERAKAEAVRVRAETERAAAEARKAAAQAAIRAEEMRLQAEVAAVRARAEAAEAEAVQKINEAKAAAIANLPRFTNQLATIPTLDGLVYRNVALARASLDGILYLIPDSAGGGCISYTNIDPAVLGKLGIDTNCIAIAKERAEVKALADARYRAIALRQGDAAAAAFRDDWENWLKRYPGAKGRSSLRSAFEKRYGITR